MHVLQRFLSFFFKLRICSTRNVMRVLAGISCSYLVEIINQRFCISTIYTYLLFKKFALFYYCMIMHIAETDAPN